MDLETFWREVGSLLAGILPSGDDDLRLFDCWYVVGEQYRLAGRAPAELVAAMAEAGFAPRPL